MKKRKKAKNVPSQKTSGSAVKSGLKYVYITAFFVLLSAFFHPVITGTSFDGVITGTLVLFVGLAGGILLYKATVSESRTMIYLGAGFGLVAISLFYIFQLTGRV